MRQTSLTCFLLLVSLGLQPLASQAADRKQPSPETISLLPASVELQIGQSQRLLVSARFSNHADADWTRSATYSSSDEQIATIDSGGIARAVAAGRAMITATVGKYQATLPLQVLDQHFPVVPEFQTDVVAALSRGGCNQGACHGSPQGKGGFILSLRGFDPSIDIASLARAEFGRRLNVLEPDNSLLLLKPTARLPHQGGRQLRKTDEAYQVLRRWIESSHPLASEPRQLDRLEVIPSSVQLHDSAPEQQLVVRAHFSNGSTQDVTGLAVFTTADNAAAMVSPEGRVSFSNTAEAAILVRYLGLIETTRLTYIRSADKFSFTSPPEKNFVDKHVFARQRELQLNPAPLASDAVFLRRVYLDSIGAIPTPEEARQFLQSNSPDKRGELIESLLQREEYSQFWSLKWADVMRANRETVSLRGVHSFHRYLVRIFADDMPLDNMARQILTSRGNTIHHPEANFFRIARTPDDAAESFSQLFLGVRIQCAKCHNHPYDSISQKDYYQLSAHFARVKLKGLRFGLDDEVVYLATEGEVSMPGKEGPVTPAAFGASTSAPDSTADRRIELAQWLTSADNRFFAHSTVNRIWFHLLGQGIVEPVDDFRTSNPPSNPELLDALAQQFIEEGYRVRPIIRTILNSSTYQLSSKRAPQQISTAAEQKRYFTSPGIRLLGAEQILDAISTATSIPELFEGYPLGTTAVSLAEGNVNHRFLKAFTRPIRDVACDCARDTDPTLNQVIHLLNNPNLLDKIDSPESRLSRWLAADLPTQQLIENIYLGSLSRYPTRQESRLVIQHLREIGDRTEAFRDLQHALFNANEFLLRH